VDTQEDCRPKPGSNNESPDQVAKANETKAMTMNMLWGLLIAFVLGVIYWVFTKYYNNGNAGNGNAGNGNAGNGNAGNSNAGNGNAGNGNQTLIDN
jgi:hypothetical protein